MHITSLNLLFLFSLCLILFILPLTTTPSLSPYVLLYHSWTYFFPPFVLFLLFSISNLCLLPLFPFLSSFFHLSFTHPFVLASTPFVFLAVYLFPSVTHTSFPSASFFFFHLSSIFSRLTFLPSPTPFVFFHLSFPLHRPSTFIKPSHFFSYSSSSSFRLPFFLFPSLPSPLPSSLTSLFSPPSATSHSSLSLPSSSSLPFPLQQGL